MAPYIGYALNAPGNYTDPTGHVPCADCDNRDEAIATSSVAAMNRYLSWRLGRPFHTIIEADFVLKVAPQKGLTNAYGSDLPGGRGMFSIPNGGPGYGPGYPDQWYNKTGTAQTQINEIKPDTPAGIATGKRDMERYLGRCDSCDPGTDYPAHNPILIDLPGINAFSLNVRNAGGGLLAYTPEVDPEAVAAYGFGAFIGAVTAAANGAMQPAPQPRRQSHSDPLVVAPADSLTKPRFPSNPNVPTVPMPIMP